MMAGPSDYEYQLLQNQVDLMAAVALLMSAASIYEPKLQPFAEKIAKSLEQDGKDTLELLT